MMTHDLEERRTGPGFADGKGILAADEMPGKMAGSEPRLSIRITRGAGSGQHLPSVLQEGRESANVAADLGFIWRISADD